MTAEPKNLFLDDRHLQQLTGRKRPHAIIEQLRKMGIEHKINGNGKPIVSTAHVENLLGGRPAVAHTAQEPNFDAL